MHRNTVKNLGKNVYEIIYALSTGPPKDNKIEPIKMQEYFMLKFLKTVHYFALLTCNQNNSHIGHLKSAYCMSINYLTMFYGNGLPLTCF